MTGAALLKTPLFDLHVAAGARMVPFAGYEMPVQYPPGVLKEHLWTREKAGLFDVSHMGQALLIAQDGRHETAALALEALVPADLAALKPGQQRYTQLLDQNGGILDDLLVTRPFDPAHTGGLALVVNASRKAADFDHISARLPAGVRLELRPDNALVALQGPAAEAVLARHCPEVRVLAFMTSRLAAVAGISCLVARSGYTGEDGFELSVAQDRAVDLWRLLAADEAVQPIGLGARDSLRLEAGLCLYGNDIDQGTSPVEADLAWSIQKSRRTGGARAGGFPGAERILAELRDGPARLRVGLRPEGRAPMRAGTAIHAAEAGEAPAIGTVTSGGFAPSLDAPVAMGYVPARMASPGTRLFGEVRGKRLPVDVAALPFVPHRYKRP